MESTNPKLNEVMCWIGMALVTVLSLFGTYYFQFSAPIKTLIWIIWLVLSLGLGFFTTKGKAFYSFVKEAKIEMQKVVWPTRQETIQTTSIVMIMVTVTGFILWGVDSGMMWTIAKITHLG